MMGRLLLAVLLLVLLPPPLRASPGVTQGPTQVMEDGQILRGRFVQERHLKGFNAPLRSEGRFVLAFGKGLIWQAEKPFAVTTAITPAGLLQQVDGSETARIPATRLPFLAKLYDMLAGALAGDWRGLESEFTAVRSGDADDWSVLLTSRQADDPAAPFQQIVVRGSRFVDEVVMTKPDGDGDTLTFLDQILSTAPASPEEAALFSALE